MFFFALYYSVVEFILLTLHNFMFDIDFGLLDNKIFIQLTYNKKHCNIGYIRLDLINFNETYLRYLRYIKKYNIICRIYLPTVLSVPKQFQIKRRCN